LSVSNASSPGTWLAALCAREGMPFVLGHALSMKAIHGGKANNDKIDAHKIAALPAEQDQNVIFDRGTRTQVRDESRQTVIPAPQ
jgi:hypothetical protein